LKFLKTAKKINFSYLSLILIVIISVFFYSNKTKTSILENFSYSATIISLIFIAFQVRLAVKDYKITNDRLRKDKAIELAKYYEETILPLSTKLSWVFKEIDLNRLYSNIDEQKMIDFDNDELIGLCSSTVIQDYMEILQSKECKDVYNKFCIIIEDSMDFNTRFNLEIDGIEDCDIDERELSSALESFTDMKTGVSLGKTISGLLNKLEFFAMNFNYNIADESVVYQSLHQSYRGVIKLLYIQISSLNKDPKDKYYTNVIELFNTWNKRYLEIVEKEKSNKVNSIHRGEKLKV